MQDLINESYHVLFVNNIHCFNAQINEIILESLKLLQNENTTVKPVLKDHLCNKTTSI